MTAEEQIELEKRLARYIAERLAASSPEEPPLMRLRAAYEASREIIIRAKWGFTPLEEIAAKLDYLEAIHYEI